ncbi:hypothetical protein RRF57_004656 [Xylaria bambusicola]|uniref:Uncharacterized protein n=1 Tax=Xylaria bambusicola TaxID=326684 RepID=A0AAN7Z4J2_9PEZI
MLTSEPEADMAGDVFLDDDDGSVVFRGSISTHNGNTNRFLKEVRSFAGDGSLNTERRKVRAQVQVDQ